MTCWSQRKMTEEYRKQQGPNGSQVALLSIAFHLNTVLLHRNFRLIYTEYLHTGTGCKAMSQDTIVIINDKPQVPSNTLKRRSNESARSTWSVQVIRLHNYGQQGLPLSLRWGNVPSISSVPFLLSLFGTCTVAGRRWKFLYGELGRVDGLLRPFTLRIRGADEMMPVWEASRNLQNICLLNLQLHKMSRDS